MLDRGLVAVSMATAGTLTAVLFPFASCPRLTAAYG